jgi:hypothetical protein
MRAQGLAGRWAFTPDIPSARKAHVLRLARTNLRRGGVLFRGRCTFVFLSDVLFWGVCNTCGGAKKRRFLSHCMCNGAKTTFFLSPCTSRGAIKALFLPPCKLGAGHTSRFASEQVLGAAGAFSEPLLFRAGRSDGTAPTAAVGGRGWARPQRHTQQSSEHFRSRPSSADLHVRAHTLSQHVYSRVVVPSKMVPI